VKRQTLNAFSTSRYAKMSCKLNGSIAVKRGTEVTPIIMWETRCAVGDEENILNGPNKIEAVSLTRNS
jgi:hypothetical protein